MNRFSSMLFFVAVLVLANFVHSSPDDVQTFNLEQQEEATISLNENNIVTGGQSMLTSFSSRSGFIGDLRVGDDRQLQETYCVHHVTLWNPMNEVVSRPLRINVPYQMINFISIENERGSRAVICDTPNTLGYYTSIVNVRVPPRSRSMLKIVLSACG